jgi:hypothetical protein
VPDLADELEPADDGARLEGVLPLRSQPAFRSADQILQERGELTGAKTRRSGRRADALRVLRHFDLA